MTAEPLTMYEFKGGTVHEVDQSWIGSSAASEQYQGYNLGVLTPKNTGSVSISVEMQSDQTAEAIQSYQKGLQHSESKPKAQFLYKIAVCYLNLRDIDKSLPDFQNAINLDSSLQKAALDLIAKYKAIFKK